MFEHRTFSEFILPKILAVNISNFDKLKKNHFTGKNVNVPNFLCNTKFSVQTKYPTNILGLKGCADVGRLGLVMLILTIFVKYFIFIKYFHSQMQLFKYTHWRILVFWNPICREFSDRERKKLKISLLIRQPCMQSI